MMNGGLHFYRKDRLNLLKLSFMKRKIESYESGTAIPELVSYLFGQAALEAE